MRPGVRGLPTASLRLLRRLIAGSVSGRRADDENRQVSRVPLPDFVPSIGETYPASSEDITPPFSLIRTHAPIPFGSPLLPAFASLEKSLQVATSPCCHRDLPDVISASPSRDAWTPTTTACRLHLPAASPATSAFPKRAMGRRAVTFR